MKETTKLKIQRFTTNLGQGFAMGAFAGMTVGLVVGTIGVLMYHKSNVAQAQHQEKHTLQL
jgi:hypothetical protein